MIKEKYIPHLAALAMLLVVALVIVGSVFNLTTGNEKQDVTTISQPEYMSKIFDKDQMLQINIQIDENNWEELKENAAAEEYYPADITINGETYKNVGIRAKGNSSLTMVANDDTTDRYSFKIKVDEYQDQSIYGLQKFVLNNMIGDATYMKEYLSYDMYKEMGIATPGYAFANITINGEAWGVYLAVETLEESFVERNFGDLDGNLYKVESMGGMGGGNKGGGNPPEMPNGAPDANNKAIAPQTNESQDDNNQTGNMIDMPSNGQNGNTQEGSTQGTNPEKAPEMPSNAQNGNTQDGKSSQNTVSGIKQISAVTTIQEAPPAQPDGNNMQAPPEGMLQGDSTGERPEGEMLAGESSERERPTGDMPPMGEQDGVPQTPPEQNGNMTPPNGDAQELIQPNQNGNVQFPMQNERPEPSSGNGAIEGAQGDMPEANENMSQMPNQDNDQAVSDSTDMPSTEENATVGDQVVEDQNQNGNRGQMKGLGRMGGMGSSGGANLVYTDDEISSYSSIFNYTILKKTTENDYATLINILKNLNAGTNLEECIDVEEVLKYFAINTFLVNLDSYAGNMKHNFYLYEEDGKLQILPWDYNLAFGAFEMTNGGKVINFPIDTPVTDSMENSPLISKLLEVEEYKAMYHSYLQELIDKYITSGKYEQTIEKLDALIGKYVKADATAFYTYDEYQTAIKELKQYGTDRTTSILAQLAGEQPSTDYGTVATSINLMAMGQQNIGKGGLGGDEQNGGKGSPGGALAQMLQGDNAASTERQMQGENAVNSTPPDEGQGNGLQGDGMSDMPHLDMETMQQIMSIVGEVSSAEELTEEQKAQITALGVDENTLDSLFNMKNNFKGMGGQHPGMSAGMTQTKMSTEDKIMAGVCSILLISGLIFVVKFKRKRY